MKIKSICDLVTVYNAIFNFYVDSSVGERGDVGSLPALNYFISSYNELGNLVAYWKKRPGSENMFKCSIK